MHDGLRKVLPVSGGNAGTQRSFLDECWELAYPGGSGTHGYAGTQPDAERSRVPERTQEARLRWNPDDTGVSGLRACVPRGSAEEKNEVEPDWVGDARKVIAQFTDPTLRSDFTDHYAKTAAALEYEQDHPRQTAEMLAFGELLAEILRRGIDVKAATRPLATGKRGESDGSNAG